MSNPEKTNSQVKSLAEQQWSEQHAKQIGDKDRKIENCSGIWVQPLYTPSNL